MSEIVKCPCCDGWGVRPDPQITGQTLECRPCQGSGILVIGKRFRPCTIMLPGGVEVEGECAMESEQTK